jgi:hypothetical protein
MATPQDILNAANLGRGPGGGLTATAPQPQAAQQGALNSIKPSVSASEDVRTQLEDRLLGRAYGDENVEGSLAKLGKDTQDKLQKLSDFYTDTAPISDGEKWLAIGQGLGGRRRRDGGSSIYQAATRVGEQLLPIATKENQLKQAYKEKALTMMYESSQLAYKQALQDKQTAEKLLLAKSGGAGGRYEIKVGPNGMMRIDKTTGVAEMIDPNTFYQARMSAEQRVRERFNKQDTIDRYAESYGADATRQLNADMQAELDKLTPAAIAEFVGTTQKPSAQGQVPGAPQPSAQNVAPSALPAAPSAPQPGAGFTSAVGNVLPREGGFVGKDGQSGAPANFGINQAANPDVDVKNLTEDKAKEIYKTRYWDAIEADKLNPAAQEIAFDAAVNQGQGYAKELIRKTGGDPQKMIDQRRRDYIKIVEKDPKKINDFRGWMNRLDDVAAKAGVTSPTGQVPGTTGAPVEEPVAETATGPTVAPKVEVAAQAKGQVPVVTSATLEANKQTASVIGKAKGEAIAGLPKAESTAKETLKTILELDQHPGKAQAVGKTAMTGMQVLPFTQAGGFMNKLEQLKGKSFLQAFETLKGGGQITEIEGTKATNAINRLNNWTSEEEFQTAVDELKDIVYSALERSYKQAGKPVPENFRSQIDAQVKPTPRSKGFAKKAPVNKAVQSQFQIVDEKK